ncbi:MAG: hypothetical protein WC872_04030 [Candidatus Absconditabacterales bacterium]|jgi:hypothetical protein
MRKEIAWGPDDVKGLFIKDENDGFLANVIRKTINNELIDAYENKNDLILMCRESGSNTKVEILKEGRRIAFSHGDAHHDDSEPETKSFEKAIGGYKKKWGEKLTQKKDGEWIKYIFRMF